MKPAQKNPKFHWQEKSSENAEWGLGRSGAGHGADLGVLWLDKRRLSQSQDFHVQRNVCVLRVTNYKVQESEKQV